MPIGGFISAQIVEIWAVWKEHTRLFDGKGNELQCGNDEVKQLVEGDVPKNVPNPMPVPPMSLSLPGCGYYTLSTSESTTMIVRSDIMILQTPDNVSVPLVDHDSKTIKT